jgi:hypothetical protein
MHHILLKQNNGFEYFCRTYRIVPDLVNEVFVRRISQYMRYIVHIHAFFRCKNPSTLIVFRAFNDNKFSYFFGCLVGITYPLSAM